MPIGHCFRNAPPGRRRVRANGETSTDATSGDRGLRDHAMTIGVAES